MDGVRAQVGIFFALGSGEQPVAVAPYHEAVENSPFYVSVGGGSIDICERLAALFSSKQSQIFQSLPLQVRVRFTARDLAQDLP